MSSSPGFNRWNDDDQVYHEYGKQYGERYDDYDTQYRTNLARPFAALSLVGSLYILYDILNQYFHKERRQGDINTALPMNQKLMVGLSVSDSITSLMYLLGTVLVPKRVWHQGYLHGARILYMVF